MLLGKEIKKAAISITFFVFIIALLAMPLSQDVLNFSNHDVITAPKQGEDYGIQQKEVPELIMPAAFNSLYNEFTANEYIAYPIGFYKNVKLNETDKEKMAEIEKTLYFINQGKCENAVALIVSGFEKNISGFTLKIADNECGNLWGAYDLGLSDSLLILKAKEQNLDTLIMGLRDSEKIRKILNIPENIQIMSVISVGERKESEIKKPPKKTFDEIVFKY